MRFRLTGGQICGLAAFLAAATFLGFAVVHAPASAAAAGGGYSFDGGTQRERATVSSALAASSFDWSLIPGQVTIHVTPRGSSYASKGEIWLDSAMLAHGRAAWGIVQHEYALQIDFFLFDAKIRARLNTLLHGKVWWPGRESLRHSQYGAERFASTLAYAYWPSSHNTLIKHARAETTAMAPARFRTMMSDLVASL